MSAYGGIKRDKTDKVVSDLVRYRDDYTCQRCEKRYMPPTMALHAAHFKGRGHKATRHDPANIDSLCYGCHSYFGQNWDEHRAWKVKQIGERAVTILEYRARHPFKITRAEMELLHQDLKQQMEKHKADYINRAGRPKERTHEQQVFLENVNNEPF